jgi:hypothetical protein
MKSTPETRRMQLADLIYDAFYTAGIGGSAVALFFLFTDALAGQPLLTPSILGSSLFLGADASSVTSVRMDGVIAYSAFHLLACSVLGSLVALVVHALESFGWSTGRVMLATFVLMQVAFLSFAAISMPSVVERIGMLQIAAANLFAASLVTASLRASRRSRAAAVVAR